MHDLPGELERDNEEAFGALVEQLRALSGGVIPFVGAGMSKAFEFPTWEQFLREEAQGSEEVLEQVDAGDYLNAAQTLQARLGGDRFHRRINHVFGREPAVAEVSKGPLSLLASLVRGPVITTNFDRVLERVFAGVDNQFDDVIIGAQLEHRACHPHRQPRAAQDPRGRGGADVEDVHAPRVPRELRDWRNQGP